MILSPIVKFTLAWQLAVQMCHTHVTDTALRISEEVDASWFTMSLRNVKLAL